MADYEEEKEKRGSNAETAGREAGKRIGKRLAEQGASKAASSGAAGAASSGAGTAAGSAAVGSAAAGGGAAAGGAAGSVVPVAGTAAGAAVGAAAGVIAAKTAKYIVPIAGALAILVPVILLIIVAAPVILILLVFGIVDVGQASDPITATITTDVPDNKIPDTVPGGSRNVEFTIVITNNLDEQMTNVGVTILDSTPITNCSETGYDIGILDAGASSPPHIVTCTIPIDADALITLKIRVTYTIEATDSDGNPLPPQTESRGKTSPIIVVGHPPGGPPIYWPLKSPVSINRPFKYEDPVYYCGYHSGTDIGTGSSDKRVYSPFAGQAMVVRAEKDSNNSSGYGQYVDLQSGSWLVRMAHMDPVVVDTGQMVDVNTELGTMDDTGISDGNHVHFEVGNTSLDVGCSIDMLIDSETLGLTAHP